MAFSFWIFYTDNVILGAAISLFIAWAGYFGIHILGLIYGKYRLHRKADPDCENCPPVSIIKPLVGVDSNLASNLETFFTQKYSKYELLFTVHSECDSAIMLVQSLMAKHSGVDAQLFIGGHTVGINPKVNNMMPAYEHAKYDLIMISDAGMRVREDTLTDMVCAMTERVGMVTQLPFTMDRKGFAATLEKVYFGCAQSRIYLAAHMLSFVCTTGMSSLLRKPLIDDAGGLAAFGQFIAEDYFLSQAMTARGYSCAISSQPGIQNSGLVSVGHLYSRLSRWAKLRFAMVPSTLVLEPMQECMAAGLIGAWSANVLFQWNALIFMLIHMLVWMLLDYILLCTVQNGPLPFSKFEFVVCWLFRELTCFPLYIKTICNQGITWGGNSFRLKWGGTAELLPRKC